MGSLNPAGTVWALRGLWDAAGIPREHREPRNCLWDGSQELIPAWMCCCVPRRPDPTPCSWERRIPRENPTGGSHRRIPWDSSPSSPGAAQIFSAAESVSSFLLLCATVAAPVGPWEGAGTIKSRGRCPWMAGLSPASLGEGSRAAADSGMGFGLKQ